MMIVMMGMVVEIVVMVVMMVVQTSNEAPSPSAFTLCQGGDDCFDVDGDVFLVVIVIGGCGGGDE